MKLKVEITKADLIQMVLERIREKTGQENVSINNVKIETRSTQNYKSEWEFADFRATYEGEI